MRSKFTTANLKNNSLHIADNDIFPKHPAYILIDPKPLLYFFLSTSHPLSPPVPQPQPNQHSPLPAAMASYAYQPPQSSSYASNAANNLNFYQSTYPNQPVSGHSTPFQAAYGSGTSSNAYPQAGYGGGASGGNFGFGAFPGQPGASGQMGTGQGGLRTGLLAAFGTEGYEGEPPLLEELGVNFGHIQMKVCFVLCL